MKVMVYIMIGIGVLSIMGCSHSSSDDDSQTTQQSIPISQCDSYTTIQDGDTLVKDENETVVKIVENNTSTTVCVEDGSAHLLR